MKKSLLALAIILTSAVSHAGWLAGSDSFKNGLVRISKQDYTNDIVIEKCEDIRGMRCQEIAVRGNLSIFMEKRVNNLQTTGAVLANIFPAAFGVTGFAAAVSLQGVAAGLVPGLTALGAGGVGQVILTKVKQVNVLRVHDFAKAFSDGFIEDDSKLIAFPDDTIDEIIYELI